MQWKCYDTANCTADEMANKQWGSSQISFYPRFNGDIPNKYFPKVYTISEWGNYKTYGAPIPLEFKYYNIEYTFPKSVTLNETSVSRIMESWFIERGMNNLYNSVKLSSSNRCLNTTMLSDWNDLYGISYYYFSQPM